MNRLLKFFQRNSLSDLLNKANLTRQFCTDISGVHDQKDSRTNFKRDNNSQNRDKNFNQSYNSNDELTWENRYRRKRFLNLSEDHRYFATHNLRKEKKAESILIG
jgi:hypothetical protein